MTLADLEALVRAVPSRGKGVIVLSDGTEFRDDMPDYPAIARAVWEAVEEERAPTSLSDAIVAARAKWYKDHGGKDTIQVLYAQMETRLAALVAERDALHADLRALRETLEDSTGLLKALEGSDANEDGQVSQQVSENITAFAAQARAEEREACAALIWTWADRLGGFEAQQLIEAIRARGERT